MRRILVAVALAVTASVSLGFTPAMAWVSKPLPLGASLGIDIAGLPLDPTDVQNFLSSLDPWTRAGVEGGCATYQRYPNAADSVQTLHFCAVVRGAA